MELQKRLKAIRDVRYDFDLPDRPIYANLRTLELRRYNLPFALVVDDVMACVIEEVEDL